MANGLVAGTAAGGAMGAGASISDQLGAMALIDGFRHQQMVVGEYLDLPRRRVEVANKIRAYYAAQNITVEDALIEDGVHRYFDQRLTFEAPVVTGMRANLAGLYIKRERWLTKTAIAALVVAVLAGGAWRVQHGHDQALTAAVQVQEDQLARAYPELLAAIKTQRDKLATLQNTLLSSPLPAAARLLKSVPEKLDEAAALAQINLPAQANEKNRDAIAQSVSAAQATLTNASAVLSGATAALTEVSTLLGANSRFHSLLAEPEFIASKRDLPVLEQAEKDAQFALEQADKKGVPAAEQAVNHLVKLAADAPKITAQLGELKTAKQALISLGLSKDDTPQIDAIASKGESAAQKLDADGVAAAIRNLQTLHQFAQTPLTLNIVDRSGVKTGVERKYGQGSGKSWYLIVEAVDAAGSVVPMLIPSAETGQRSSVKQFGVRVSKEIYDDIKAQKQATGHVSERQIGTKPANSLSVQFNAPLPAKPDTITKW